MVLQNRLAVLHLHLPQSVRLSRLDDSSASLMGCKFRLQTMQVPILLLEGIAQVGQLARNRRNILARKERHNPLDCVDFRRLQSMNSCFH